MLHGDLEAPEYETHRRVGETEAKSTAYVLANLLDYDVDACVDSCRPSRCALPVRPVRATDHIGGSGWAAAASASMRARAAFST